MIIDVFKRTGETTVQSLRQSFAQKDVNASGRLSRSLDSKVTSDVNTVRLVVDALGYVFEVEEGKPPPPQSSRARVADILRWITEKQLPLFSGFRDRDAMAFVITRSINQQGTKRHYTNTKSGAISDVINDDLIREIERQLADDILADAITAITRVSRN